MRIRVGIGKRRKLLIDEKIEVRSTEDGFLGSWHSGTVISSEKGIRLVEYDHILSDNNNSNDDDQDCCSKLTDSINVSDVIDGIASTDDMLVLDYCYRGLIRPVPPLFDLRVFKYGQCVDVYYKDAWWEGVIFDCYDGYKERSVFFPDMGDELKVDVCNMRVSQDWDECSGVWKARGKWLFLELIDEFEKDCWPVVVSVKQIWYDVRVKKGFDENVKEWTCLKSDVWRGLLSEVVVDNFRITMKEFFQKVECSGEKGLEECSQLLERNGPDLYDLMKSKPFDEIVVSVVESDRLDTIRLGSSVKPTREDEALCASPPKLAIVASDTDDESSKGKKCTNREESCNSSRKVSKQSKYRVWVSADRDIVPEFFVDAIEEYLEVYGKVSKTRCKNLHKVALNLRRHLLFLDWKVEYFQDKGFRRWRYTQPDGNMKCFLSLLTVCEHFKKSDSAKVSLFPQDQPNKLFDAADPTVLSPLAKQSQGCKKELIKNSPYGDNGMFEPEYCPQAIINYYSCEIKEKVYATDHDKLKDMQLKAKKHLSAVGWKLYYIYKNNMRPRELRYSSPCGKLYFSLRSACKGYLTEKRNVVKLAEAQLGAGEGGLCSAIATKVIHGKHKKKRKSSALHLASCSRSSKSLKKENNSTEVQARDNLNCAISGRELGSRKRAREVVVLSSYHRNPRTVLSWLIDNNVVLPREKVQYRRDDKTMAEGRVTRYGIKCNCCQEIFTVGKFEVHAISTRLQPSANLFLEDGRSLLECMIQLGRDINARGSTKVVKGKQQQKKMSDKEVRGKQQQKKKSDCICSVCQVGGDLILCDGCPSSFHTCCLGLDGVPDGDWFCPSCCCKSCGRSEKNGYIEVFTDNSVIKCNQCELRYHIGCLRMKDLVLKSYPKGYWFCSKKCEHISFALQKLLGKPIEVGKDNLTWTLLKYVKPDECDDDISNIADSTENYCKLSVALGLMHECFKPVKERWTRRDLVEDVIFNRWSELNRLNFRGFYTVLLEKNDELITAATVRIYGEKVAEVPFVATRVRYQRRGMCRILMNELEKVLREAGVERLVLPAIPNVLNTWISSFGFSRMPQYQRLKLLDYTILDFHGTTMCQKLLSKTACLLESSPPTSIKQHCGVAQGNVNLDPEGSSSVSKMLQADRVVGQRCMNGKILLCYKRRRISKPVGAQVSAC